MEIEYYRKNVYGNELMYVADQENAKHISRLTGRGTINDSDIRTLEVLGCKFKEVLAPRKA